MKWSQLFHQQLEDNLCWLARTSSTPQLASHSRSWMSTKLRISSIRLLLYSTAIRISDVLRNFSVFFLHLFSIALFSEWWCQSPLGSCGITSVRNGIFQRGPNPVRCHKNPHFQKLHWLSWIGTLLYWKLSVGNCHKPKHIVFCYYNSYWLLWKVNKWFWYHFIDYCRKKS